MVKTEGQPWIPLITLPKRPGRLLRRVYFVPGELATLRPYEWTCRVVAGFDDRRFRFLESEIVFVIAEGVRFVESVTIRPTNPDGVAPKRRQVTSEAMRAVKFERIQADLSALLASPEAREMVRPAVLRQFRRRGAPGPTKRGRAPSPPSREGVSERRRSADLRLARTARTYLEWVARSTTPLRDMADRERVLDDTLRHRLHRARKRELLTDPLPGRPGGELTPYAHQLLEQEGS